MDSNYSKDLDILLIEDDPNDADMILRALKKGDLMPNLRHVQDGAIAMEVLQDIKKYGGSSPKLIILDLSMPKMNGSEILEMIKNDIVFKTIPVVILTSSREEKDLKRCYSQGVNSYIVKPVDYNNFSETIRDVGRYWLQLNIRPQ